jgi:hypothetical protein
VVGLTGLAIAFVLGVGTWGFYSLKTQPRLGLPLAIYRSLHLFTVDLGPAAGGNGSPRANWQLWAAFIVAGLLVLQPTARRLGPFGRQPDDAGCRPLSTPGR